MSESTPPPDNALSRVCRKCSVQSSTTGNFCPNCGAPYIRGNKIPRLSKKRALAAIAVLVLVLGSAGGLVVKHQHDKEASADRAAAAAAETAEKEAQDTQDAADLQEATDDAERTVRGQLVKELEKNIVKSAKKVVGTGYFDGPILSAQCTATGGGSTDDLTALTGTFDCLAVNKENGDGTLSGYGYDGTIDWQDATLSWEPSS